MLVETESMDEFTEPDEIKYRRVYQTGWNGKCGRVYWIWCTGQFIQGDAGHQTTSPGVWAYNIN
jgi:hypothetical protein